MHLKVILELGNEGRFTVFVPALSGCISEGYDRKQPMANISETVELYLELIARLSTKLNAKRSKCERSAKLAILMPSSP